jgi:hypothetical protein
VNSFLASGCPTVPRMGAGTELMRTSLLNPAGCEEQTRAGSSGSQSDNPEPPSSCCCQNDAYQHGHEAIGGKAVQATNC